MMEMGVFNALSSPQSDEHFAQAMKDICREAGAELFMLLQLSGLARRDIDRAVHNGGPAVDEIFEASSHIAVERLLVGLSLSPMRSLMLGAPGGFTLDIPGYANGVAALTRDKHFGCIVVFARAEPFASFDERMLMLGSANLAAQMALAGFVPNPPQACPLRGRELECLRHYAAGMSPKQTGELLGISERTVEGHLERARLRCAVETTLAAAMKALHEGWIQPSEISRLEAAG